MVIASESNEQNPQDRTLDLPFFFRYKHIPSLETTFLLHKARVCPTSLVNFCGHVRFDLLLERISFVWSLTRFEMKYQFKKLLLSYYKICSCFSN